MINDPVAPEDKRDPFTSAQLKTIFSAKPWTRPGGEGENPNGAAPLLRAGRGNQDAIRAVQAQAAERAREYAEIIEDIQASGVASLAGIARELNERGIVTPRGGRWHASSVKNLLARSAA